MDENNLSNLVQISKEAYDRSIEALSSTNDRSKDLVFVIGAIIGISTFSVETLLKSHFYLVAVIFFFMSIIVCLFSFYPKMFGVVTGVNIKSKDLHKVKYLDYLTDLNADYLKAFDDNKKANEEKVTDFKLAVSFVISGAILLIVSYIDVGNNSFITKIIDSSICHLITFVTILVILSVVFNFKAVKRWMMTRKRLN